MAPKNTKKPCKYGGKCYRKNPDHLREFSHQNRQEEEDDEQDSDLTENKNVTDEKREEEINSPSQDLEEQPIKKRKIEHNVSDSDSTIPVPSPSPSDDNNTLEAQDAQKEEDPTEGEDSPALSQEEDDNTVPSPGDVKENIKSKYLVEMPDDFYQFWDFCTNLNSSNPLDALKCLKLKLVGPFDIVAGKHKSVKKNKHGRQPNYLLHYRYYYDPPEFQTVLVSEEKDHFHIGYFRDDSKEAPVFLASNSPGSSSSKEKITSCGENIFAAVHIHATKMLKTATPFAKTSIQKLMKSIEKVASNLDIDLSPSTKSMKARQKKVVCPSFHSAGIVVPVDDNEIGYRPVPESPGDLKAIFKRIAEAKTDKEKDRHMEALEELITLIQFANDEMDYGEGLELGIDLFSYGGDVFHPQISILLPLAYDLLNRSPFGKIISTHLSNRRKIGECVDELAL